MKRGEIDYRLVHKIEKKYGSLENCPENDEDLRELRRKLNVSYWLKMDEKYHDKNK